MFGSFRNSFIIREALRIAPERPNFALGLRAGLATTAPLLLSAWLGQPELVWTGLAGFSAVLADKGGAYRTRALSMLALALTGSLATLIGTSAALHPRIGVLATLVVVGAGGFVRLFGAEATSIGVLTSVSLIVALARPASGAGAAFTAAGFFLAGCVWAALLSLLLWPIRPYRPASLAVGAALRELARIADTVLAASTTVRRPVPGLRTVGPGGGAAQRPGTQPSIVRHARTATRNGTSWAAAAQFQRRQQLGRAREAFERARAALVRSRRGRPGPSFRGEQLVALLEAGDQLFGVLVALEDELALEPQPPRAGKRWLEPVAELISAELARVAAAVEAEQLLPPEPPLAALAELAHAIQPLSRAPREHVPRLLLRALEWLERVRELARAYDPAEAPPSRAEPSDLSSHASKRSLLRDQLTLDSAVFRHALRVGLSTAGCGLLTHALSLDHGYWASLTCLVILQPHGAATWAKALQRVLGTVLGAGLAVLVASFVEAPHAIVGFVFVFVSLGMALLPLNYGAFAVFLTPGFVLLAETHAGHLHLALPRVLNTLLGAGVALLASRLLFPLSERDQIRPLLAKALDELVRLLRVTASERPSAIALRAVRRNLGLALLNAEASYQRLLSETDVKPEEGEAVLSLLLYAHRLAAGSIALALTEGTPSHAFLVEHGSELGRAVEDLRQSVAARGLPAAVPQPLTARAESSERIERLFQQLAILRDAVFRWNAS